AMRVPRQVAVVGGGNTSIDCLTQARALGAEEVTLVYRRSRAEMPAYAHEVELARRWGCRFLFQHAPLRIDAGADGRGAGLVVQPMRLAAPGPDGRRRPEPAPDHSPTTLPCQLVIAATGQETHAETQSIPGVRTEDGRILVDERTMQTSNPRYFAGGDCVSG